MRCRNVADDDNESRSTWQVPFNVTQEKIVMKLTMKKKRQKLVISEYFNVSLQGKDTIKNKYKDQYFKFVDLAMIIE